MRLVRAAPPLPRRVTADLKFYLCLFLEILSAPRPGPESSGYQKRGPSSQAWHVLLVFDSPSCSTPARPAESTGGDSYTASESESESESKVHECTALAPGLGASCAVFLAKCALNL
jgi:hypothetical protein